MQKVTCLRDAEGNPRSVWQPGARRGALDFTLSPCKAPAWSKCEALGRLPLGIMGSLDLLGQSSNALPAMSVSLLRSLPVHWNSSVREDLPSFTGSFTSSLTDLRVDACTFGCHQMPPEFTFFLKLFLVGH